jgi:hypothetical protein
MEGVIRGALGVKHVPDAGSYAPVIVLIDERAYGDGNDLALRVARDLDAKVERLLRQAAA